MERAAQQKLCVSFRKKMMSIYGDPTERDPDN